MLPIAISSNVTQNPHWEKSTWFIESHCQDSTHPSTFPIALAIFCPSCLFSRENMLFMFKQMFWKVIETSSFASDQVLLKPSPPSAGASGRTCRLYVTTFVIVNFTFTYSDIGNSEPAFRWRKHPVSLTLHQSPSLNISIIFGFSMVMILYSVMCFQAFSKNIFEWLISNHITTKSSGSKPELLGCDIWCQWFPGTEPGCCPAPQTRLAPLAPGGSKVF